MFFLVWMCNAYGNKALKTVCEDEKTAAQLCRELEKNQERFDNSYYYTASDAKRGAIVYAPRFGKCEPFTVRGHFELIDKSGIFYYLHLETQTRYNLDGVIKEDLK